MLSLLASLEWGFIEGVVWGVSLLLIIAALGYWFFKYGFNRGGGR